jgi:hypothetical protein
MNRFIGDKGHEAGITLNESMGGIQFLITKIR